MIKTFLYFFLFLKCLTWHFKELCEQKFCAGKISAKFGEVIGTRPRLCKFKMLGAILMLGVRVNLPATGPIVGCT